MKRCAALVAFVLMLSLVLCACAPSARENSDTVRVAVMQGPTGMGMVKLMSDREGDASVSFAVYDSANGAQLIVAGLLDGSLDMACLPCNVAATAYAKGADIAVAAVGTLAVLYVLENGQSVQSLDDLNEKRIYTVNKGSSPEYLLRYVLAKAGVEAEIVFEEQTTVQTRLLGKETVVAVLPEPLCSSVRMQSNDVRRVLALGDAFQTLSGGVSFVTGVLVVNRSFAAAHPDTVKAFLKDYAASVRYASGETDGAATLCERYGIVSKAALAKKALPYCRLSFEEGKDMERDVRGCLQTLFDQNPASVGGVMPDDGFYYGVSQ